MKGIKDDKRTMFLMIIVVILAFLNLYLYSELIQTRSALSVARDEITSVSGIIVSLSRVEYEGDDEGASYIGLLRLTTNDSVNGVGLGEISDYRIILDGYVELDVGNLVSGTPIKEEMPALKVERVTPFLHPPIVNAGEYIDFERVRINTFGPSLHLGLHNLGEKDIISVRAEVNGSLIPFFFGVDKEHPVKPYGYGGGSVPTSWFDPAMNGTVGFKPVEGEAYPIVVELTLSDDRPNYVFKTVKTWNFSVTAVFFGSIELLVDTGTHIEIRSAYLFEYPGEGDFLSLKVKNVWSKTVTSLTILVDDVQVAAVKTNLGTGGYWKACVGLPFNIYIGSSHNVTIRALTAEGKVAEVSKKVRCDIM